MHLSKILLHWIPRDAGPVFDRYARMRVALNAQALNEAKALLRGLAERVFQRSGDRYDFTWHVALFTTSAPVRRSPGGCSVWQR